jgi:hypothetical protein
MTIFATGKELVRWIPGQIPKKIPAAGHSE